MVVGGLSKTAALLLLLYLFVCCLNLLASAFRLVGGRTASAVFRQSQVLSNPVVGLMIGVVVTALVQSSSTSSSIIVSMVAANFLDVRTAVPLVMGANIGTSLTNTLVSLGQVADRKQFERSFSGAVVHDMFNWLCVLVLLPLEVATGYLYHLSNVVLSAQLEVGYTGVKLHLLSALTKPLTEKIVRLDKNVLMGWSLGDPNYENSTLLLRMCPLNRLQSQPLRQANESQITGNVHTSESMNKTLPDANEKVNGISSPSNRSTETLGRYSDAYNSSSDDLYYGDNDTYLPYNETLGYGVGTVYTTCPTLTAHLPLSDTGVGLVLLATSLVLLTLCLVAIVRTLSSVLKGSVARLVQRVLNADLPMVPWLTGYLAILAGAAFTFLLQSSSIFTSTLTPLVGLGMISVERVYPLTLGSNLGTTTTALLAALASDSASLRPAIQIALVHLFFNVTGLMLWYPIPFLRVPVKLALALGKVTSEYRWFAIVYILLSFCIVPLFVFFVSLGGTVLMYSVLIPIFLIFLFIILVNVLQVKCPNVLPSFLRTWLWLPLPLRSLEPYDNVLSHLMCCVKNSNNTSHVYSYVTPAPATEVTTCISEQVVVVVEDETACKNHCCGTSSGYNDSGDGVGINVGKIGSSFDVCKGESDGIARISAGSLGGNLNNAESSHDGSCDGVSLCRDGESSGSRDGAGSSGGGRDGGCSSNVGRDGGSSSDGGSSIGGGNDGSLGGLESIAEVVQSSAPHLVVQHISSA